MNNIARMLREGEGVTKDIAASLEWYGKAIDAGNAYAPRQLAEMYRKGWGVKKDSATALRYYRLAAERGFVEAYADVAAMYEAGDGARKDATEAYFHYRLAREAGLRREQRFSLPQADQGIARLEPRLSAEARAGIDRRLEEELARIGPVPALGFI
jgi:TPR repeat protein